MERFRGIRGFGIDELLSHRGTTEVHITNVFLLQTNKRPAPLKKVQKYRTSQGIVNEIQKKKICW